MLQALAGEDPRDPRTFPIVGRDFAGAPAKSVEGLRIAYISDFAKIGVEPEIDEICRAATYQIGTWGAKVEEIDLDLSFAREAFLQLRGQLMVTAHLDRIGLVDKFGPNLAGNIRRGLAQGPKDVAQGEVTRSKLVDEWTKVFAKYDAVCCPCSPVAPFPVEQNYPEVIAGKKMTTYIDWVAATFLVTMAGLPAISVPAGLDANRLPVGLQIVTRRHREEQMLALAAKVEKMRPIGFAPSHA
jgi:amidase